MSQNANPNDPKTRKMMNPKLPWLVRSRFSLAATVGVCLAALVAGNAAAADELKGVEAARLLSGIKAADPARYRILEDGTYDTYTAEEKSRFATELRGLLDGRASDSDAMVDHAVLSDDEGLSPAVKRRLDELAARSAMASIRMTDLLLKRIHGVKDAVDSGSPSAVIREVLRLMDAQKELGQLRDEYGSRAAGPDREPRRLGTHACHPSPSR
ncbi:MAG: hypothetical protein OXG82_04380 [Gammaproteobacteria bacterium]|nr:hypothetical protein [Gammaproteobacteria bacterium]